MATSAEITSPVKTVKEGDSWQFNKSVIECNRHMMDSGLAADVTFLVSSSDDGKGEICKFHAHKYVLISRSPVFYAMLCGDLAETGPIMVTDMEPEAFKLMLSYIYTNELDIKPDLVMFILYASNKYLLPGLTTKCIDFLKDHLDASNACTILDQSLLFEEAELAERCMKLIKLNTKEALASDSFLAINHTTLAKILDSNKLALPEVEVFEGSLKWAKQKCKEMQQEANGASMRKVLGDCVSKFRFSAMKIDDFSRGVGQADILSPEEEVQLHRYIINRNSFSAPVGFIHKSRFVAETFDMRTSETIQTLKIGTTSFTIDIECNADISIDGLVIGKWINTQCFVSGFGLRNVTTSLQNISVNGQTCSISCFQQLESKKQEINFNSELTIKSGQSKLTMNYANTSGHIDARYMSNVYVVPKDEIILKCGGMEIKLSSNQPCMPLLGLKFKLV